MSKATTFTENDLNKAIGQIILEGKHQATTDQVRAKLVQITKCTIDGHEVFKELDKSFEQNSAKYWQLV